MPKIWVVGAGKGGVGKTFISSSLGITLAKSKLNTLLVDLDLSGANLHTTLGMELDTQNLSRFLRREDTLENIVRPTKVPRLSYVQGAWDQWSGNRGLHELAREIVQESRRMKFDYIVFDLGPGATELNIEMFKLADERILVTSAEPTSIEKSYRFLETWISCLLRSSSTIARDFPLDSILAQYRALPAKTKLTFRHYLQENHQIVPSVFDEVNRKPIHLIVNGARSQQDQDLGFNMRNVCCKFFDLNLHYLGAVDFDNAAWQSVRNREAMLIEKPFTPLSGQFLSVVKTLLESGSLPHFYRAVV